MENKITWYHKHAESRSGGQKIADRVVKEMGSWRFIIIQTVVVGLWMVLNILGIIYHWDEYPFILLNLLFSTQAAYAAPVIMMSQNRQNERDHIQALEDLTTNIEAKKEIEDLQTHINNIESKIDKILANLQK